MKLCKLNYSIMNHNFQCSDVVARHAYVEVYNCGLMAMMLSLGLGLVTFGPDLGLELCGLVDIIKTASITIADIVH